MVDAKARIVSLPDVCHGKPCVRGTRVLVSSILGSLASGHSLADVLAQYPGLAAQDVAAALDFESAAGLDTRPAP